MKVFTKSLMAFALLCIAGVISAYAEEVELTKDMFYQWDGYGADAKSTTAATVDFNIGNDAEIGGGGMVCGTGTVDYLIYADLTGSSKMLIEGTAGLPLRVLMNRQESNNGPLVEKQVTIGEDGKAEVDLSDLPYIHLNAIKVNWGGGPGKVSSIKLEKAAAVPAIELPQVLTFPDYNDAEISSYTDEWTATMNGASWTFNGFNNNKNAWSLVKCGRKNNDQTATILTPALNAVVKDVVFTVNKATNIVKVTFDVINGSETVSSTDVTDKFVAGDVDLAVDGAAGYSYKLTIESSAASANGTTEIAKIGLYGEGQYVKKTIANTEETAYTVAEAIALIDAGEALTDVVFVKGIISKIDKLESDNSITYWISEDGSTEGAQFECYKGLDLDGAAFESVDDVKVGAEVIVTGVLTKYKEIYELSAGNMLVDYKEKVGPEPVARVWDFTKWSDATVDNLKADAAASKTEGWSDVEKKADAEAGADPTEASKDNCFWYAATTNADGSLSANGVVIEELKGLVFSNSYTPNRSLAIAVNYPSTSLGDYAGGAYLWLGGGKKKVPCFTIPNVAAGSVITMEVESHKPAEGRGVELYYGLDADGLVDAATKIGDTFNPTVKQSHTWLVENAGDVIVYNTNGCHIYTITIEEGTPAPEPILTLKAPVGEEVSLTFGVYDTEDTYGVDFGDGELQTAVVGLDNKGPVKEDGTTGSATNFTGTVAGDGTIKVYGTNDIWYLVTTNGAMPTSFEQPKLMNVVQMSITGADVESVALPAYEKMTQFSLNNSSAKSVDVSKVAGLTSLTINNTTASKFEPQLESIDLSKNTELTYLSIQGNQNASGKLTSLDLTNNTKLSGMGLYVQYNKISDLKLGENTLTLINVQNNQLKSLDLAKLPGLKSLYAAANLFEGEFDLTAYETLENVQLNDNKLTSIKVNNVTKQFYVDGNELTLATIPAQPAGMNSKNKTKQFHYAPQADLEAAVSNMELDLTSQLTVAQGELNPEDFASWLTGTTTFSFLTVSGDTLVEGTDYVVVEPGKFKFLKEQAETVHAEMLNSALPKFTEAAPFKTTEFEVKEGAEEDPELVAPEGWISEIANGNLAGSDVSNYIAKEYPSTTPVGAAIVAGAGKNGTRGIVVKSQDKVDQAWDSQFWIYLNETLATGTKVHVEFDYKADKAGKSSTQCHAAPGAYLHWSAIGDVNFTEDWQHFAADFEVASEAADMQSIAFNLNDFAEANTYYFDNFGVWVQKPAPVEKWSDLIVNGNMEGESMECFYVTEQGVGGPFVAVATNGIGKDGGKAVKVQSQDNPAQDWDTQFFIRLPYQLPAGTKFKVSFDYKADKAGDFDTQAHTEPGGYIHWACIGSGSFTSDWQTYEKEGSISADMSKEGQLMQTIAFNLAKNKVATEFIFDNVKFEVEASVAATLTKNPAVDPTPYPVGIYTLSADQQNGTIFDLQGRRVVAPRKGLYIIDGKKAVVK